MFFFKLLSVIKFIIEHPLNKHNKIKSLIRFINWQFLSRVFLKKKFFKWIDDSILVAYPGESAITGNLYTGLLELNDMGFLLHFLDKKDVFVDVGANSGAYTVWLQKLLVLNQFQLSLLKNPQNVLKNT